MPPAPVLGKKGQSYMPERGSSNQGSIAGQTMKQRDQLSNQAYVKTSKYK